MVIYDTKNNYDGMIKGRLYISMLDVDYLVKKYGTSTLREMIPEDYVDAFEKELKARERERILSPQYYAILPIGIENEDDERLLSLLSQEVEMGNMLTKSQLSSLTLEELEEKMESLESVKLRPKDASIEDLYKLRSYQMSEFIMTSIQSFNNSVRRAYLGVGIQNSERDIINRSKDFEAMGITSDIEESDYFDKAVMMAKRFNGNKNG